MLKSIINTMRRKPAKSGDRLARIQSGTPVRVELSRMVPSYYGLRGMTREVRRETFYLYRSLPQFTGSMTIYLDSPENSSVVNMVYDKVSAREGLSGFAVDSIYIEIDGDKVIIPITI